MDGVTLQSNANIEDAFVNACGFGRVETIGLLLKSSLVLSRSAFNDGLKIAVRKNKKHVVRLFLRLLSGGPSSIDFRSLADAFLVSVCKGYGEITSLLVAKIPTVCCGNHNAMKIACEKGYNDIVQVLCDWCHCDHDKINLENALSAIVKTDNIDALILLHCKFGRQLKLNNKSKRTRKLLMSALSRNSINCARFIASLDKVDVANCYVTRLFTERVEVTTSAFCYFCEFGDAEIVKHLINKRGIDPSLDFQAAVIAAIRNKHSDVLEVLLADKRIDPSENCGIALDKATFYDKTRCVKLLLNDKRVDPGANGCDVVEWACTYGYFDIIDHLIDDPRVNVAMDNNIILRTASSAGKTSLVRKLLQLKATAKSPWGQNRVTRKDLEADEDPLSLEL